MLDYGLHRTSTTRWRICWSRPTRFKSPLVDLMLFPTSSMRLTSKPVNPTALATASSANLFQNSMLLPSKRKKRALRTWQTSTRHQISSTSPQSKLPRYVPSYSRTWGTLDIDVQSLSRHNRRRSSPLEGLFGLRLHSNCFIYDFVDSLYALVSVTLRPPVRDPRGTGQTITSPPPSRSPRCYHAQVFTRRPLSPEQAYRGKAHAIARLSSRSLVERRQPRTRPTAEAGPRE